MNFKSNRTYTVHRLQPYPSENSDRIRVRGGELSIHDMAQIEDRRFFTGLVISTIAALVTSVGAVAYYAETQDYDSRPAQQMPEVIAKTPQK